MTTPTISSVGGLTAAIEPRRSQIGRYALWQLRDYLMDRGAPTVIVVALFAMLSLIPMLSLLRHMADQPDARAIARYGSMAAAIVARRHEMSTNFVGGFVGIVAYLGALFAMQGIVAHDRTKGFFRFLFAKPVTPSRYYGQAFLIHAAGFAALMSALAIVYGHYVEPILTAPFLAGLLLMWLCYAGVGFLSSALVRLDWLVLVIVTVVATFAWGYWADTTNPLRILLYLLPPLHRTDEVYRAMAHRTAMPWSLVAWFAAYGVACFIAALVVLRHRRLAIP